MPNPERVKKFAQTDFLEFSVIDKDGNKRPFQLGSEESKQPTAEELLREQFTEQLRKELGNETND